VNPEQDAVVAGTVHRSSRSYQRNINHAMLEIYMEPYPGNNDMLNTPRYI
jgi:hypothetical protein